MAEYVARHGACAAAVDVANAINLNQAGAAQVITVPSGVSAIKQVKASVSASIVAVASSGVTFELVMTGNGLKTEQHLELGGLREDTTSTAGAKIAPAMSYPVDIPVNPGNQIDLNVFMHGVDPGTPQIGIELCYA